MATESTLRRHYLRLYKAADAILRQPDNPCQIHVGADGKTACRKSGDTRGPAAPGSLCCSGCPHLGPSGCTVQALGCKLGWCYTNRAQIEGMAINDHPTFIAIAALKREAVALGVPLGWRTDIDESFEQLTFRQRMSRRG